MGVPKSGPDYGLITEKGLMGVFRQEHEMILGKGWMGDIAMRTTSTQETETYRWLGLTPAVREWIGSRKAKGLNDFEIKVTNRIFELTLPISVDDLRRDKINGLRPRISQMAQRAEEHWEKLISALDVDGSLAGSTSYDGQPFYSATHVSGKSGVQSNVYEHTVVDPLLPTREEMVDAIIKGIEQMYGQKDDQGEPLNGGASNFLIMVPVNYYGTAVGATTDKLVNAGSSNTLLTQRFSVDVVVNPRFPTVTAVQKFKIFRTDTPSAAPYIAQSEVDFKLSVIGEGSEEMFKNRRWLFGIEAIREAAYGQWSSAIEVTLAV